MSERWIEELAERYASVKRMLPAEVVLVAVSKKRSVAEIRALYDLGHRDFGENYTQELRAKQPALPADIRWHFIGHLQRSNVRHLVPFIHLIHGIDGPALLDEVEKRAHGSGRKVDVLLQIHIAQEETKHGLSPEEARALVASWESRGWNSIGLRGVMGMATNSDDMAMVHGEFAGLAALHQELRRQSIDPERFDTLSMGMSGDLEAALKAGSTMVRIGTAIFGERA